MFTSRIIIHYDFAKDGKIKQQTDQDLAQNLSNSLQQTKNGQVLLMLNTPPFRDTLRVTKAPILGHLELSFVFD